MRQLFIICTIVLQLLGTYSAGAGTVHAISPQKEAGISSIPWQEHPADLSQCISIGNAAFKPGNQRLLPGFISQDYQDHPVSVFAAKHNPAYASPLYLPLVSLLLYPKHYFW